MRATALIVPLLSGLLALGGCKTDKVAESIEGLKAFKEKMCACKDADCAKKVDAEFSAFSKKMDQSLSEKQAKAASDTNRKEAGAYLQAYFACESELNEDIRELKPEARPDTDPPPLEDEELDEGEAASGRGGTARDAGEESEGRTPGQYEMRKN